MSGRSLRLRLVAGGIAAIVLALALAGLALTWLFERHVVRTIGEELDVHERQLVGSIDIDADGTLLVTSPPVDPRFADPLSGLYWQASAAGDKLVRSRSMWDTVLDLPDDKLDPGEIHRHEMPGPAKAQILVVERMVQLTHAGRPVYVRLAVAADLARASRATAAFRRDLALALTLLATVLGIATTIQVGLGLQPLVALRHRVAEIRSGERRQLPAAVPSEVQPLVEEMNALLAAQDAELERARGRAADLAHGLKTPLAALTSDARRLRDRGEADIARDIDEVAESMSRHVDRELARARARGIARGGPHAPTPLAPLVRSLVATLERAGRGETQAAPRIAFDIDLTPDLALAIDRTDLAEVLGNLIENAQRHARTRVQIRARLSENGTPSVTIGDDGPGIAPQLRATMLERGRRLDTRGDGAGLGLAIVQDVLDAYGWRLTLGTCDLGGLSARIAPAHASADRA